MYDDVTVTINANVGFIFGGGIILQMHLCSNQRLRALRSVTEIAQLLSPKDFNDLAKFIHTKDIIGFLFMVIHLPNCFTGNVYVVMQHLVAIYILITTLSIDMLYMNCVYIVKVGFRKINESLEQFNKFSTNDESNSDAPFAQKASRDKQRSTLLLMKLRNIEENHLRISDVVDTLNKTFLVYNAGSAVMTFIVVTFNLYFYIIWRHGGYTVDPIKQFWYMQFLTSVFHYTLKFSMIIWACETAKNEALEVGTTIHDVLGDATDTLVKHELELFSLQVLHRDNTFSARVVTMNTALLTQMVGGVVMYFLILIQFVLSHISCKRRD
ncbi:uncharacterized protein LOC128876581 [Hylaeus volcanicus]|uniref:uncharacterized protein LOC128876581 n=1 Tax=Hylaeus volcanicus TaxID=313075 RepID=UPI0023B7C36B|nr:uncharacterized protein LOC128876581 [Hylaeus volcanicus]